MNAQFLPFPVRVYIPATSYELSINMEAEAISSETGLQDLDDILVSFTEAANAGMFCGKKGDPTKSLMQIVSRVNISERKRKYELHVRAVELAAYKILLSMITQSHYTDEPLLNLELTSEALGGKQSNLDAVVECSWPACIHQVPFELIMEEKLPDTEEVLFRIKFTRALTEEEFDMIDLLITHWESLVILGGYLDTFEKIDEPAMNPGEIYMASPSTIENTIHEFQAPQAAINAIINMSTKLNYDLCTVEKLEIDWTSA